MEEYGGLQENADVDLSEEDDWDNAEKRQFVRHARSVTATNCGDDGAARICAWMRVMEGECSIRRLFLRRQKGVAMSCKGATALAEMLRANKCLVELDLGNNRCVPLTAHAASPPILRRDFPAVCCDPCLLGCRR